MLPLRPPPLWPILPLAELLLQERAMPRPQALKRARLGQLEQPNPIVGERALEELDDCDVGAVGGEDADDLAVDLEAVEQVADVRGVEGGGEVAVDVEPDEAEGRDGAAEDLGDVEGVDVGEAGGDGGDGFVVDGLVEGAAGVVWVRLGGWGGLHGWNLGFLGTDWFIWFIYGVTTFMVHEHKLITRCRSES